MPSKTYLIWPRVLKGEEAENHLWEKSWMTTHYSELGQQLDGILPPVLYNGSDENEWDI